MQFDQKRISKILLYAVIGLSALAPLHGLSGALGWSKNFPIVAIFLVVVSFVFSAIAVWSLRKQNDLLKIQIANLIEVVQQAESYTKEVEARQNELLEMLSEDTKSVQDAMAQITELRVLIARARMDANNSLKHTSLLSEMQATQAGAAVQEFNSAIAGMNRSQEELLSINEMMRLISQKTNVVDDIVFKTSLLSFNANIEAARAGKYGRGFAVVAQEVSKLANHTGSASKEISGLLSQSEKRVEWIVESSVETTKVAENVAKQVAETFQGVMASLDSTVPLIKSVVTVTEEQEAACDLVVSAFDVLERNVERKAKSSEAVRQASAVLEYAFSDMQRIANSLRVTDQKTTSADSASPGPQSPASHNIQKAS